MIDRLRRYLTAREQRMLHDLIDDINAEAVEQVERHHVTRPSRTIYDETVQAHGSDPLAGVKVQRISRVIGNVHGYALAAPLRGAR